MHFWIALVGVLLSVIPLYLSGFTQSMMWNSLDELGNLGYPDFIESIEASRMMWWIRILGGLLYLVGLILMTANFALTWLFRVKESCSTLKDSVEDILLPDSSSSYQQSPSSGPSITSPSWIQQGRWRNGRMLSGIVIGSSS